jgi:hypothetical protein
VANNLERFEGPDYETTVPGHGEPFKGKERIEHFQAFLRDLDSDQGASRSEVPAADAARRVDMSAHQPHYQNLSAMPGFQEATIARIYQVLDHAAAATERCISGRAWTRTAGRAAPRCITPRWWRPRSSPTRTSSRSFVFDDERAIVVNEQIRHLSTSMSATEPGSPLAGRPAVSATFGSTTRSTASTYGVSPRQHCAPRGLPGVAARAPETGPARRGGIRRCDDLDRAPLVTEAVDYVRSEPS